MSLFLRVSSQDKCKEQLWLKFGRVEWTHLFQRGNSYIKYHGTQNSFPIFICVDHE